MELSPLQSIPQHFIELEGTLPCLQEPSTGPPTCPASQRQILVLSFHVLSLFIHVLLPKLCRHFSHVHATCCTHLILRDLIFLILLCEKVTKLRVVQFATFSIALRSKYSPHHHP